MKNMEVAEVKVLDNSSETIYIKHPKSSYAIFCISKSGDLFVNSDWGFYGFAWRAFGNDFDYFLRSSNPDYIVGKFETNYISSCKKKMPKVIEENLKVLVGELIKFLSNRHSNDNIQKQSNS